MLARITFGAPATIVQALTVALGRLVVEVGPCTSRVLLWLAGVFDALVVVLAGDGQRDHDGLAFALTVFCVAG